MKINSNFQIKDQTDRGCIRLGKTVSLELFLFDSGFARTLLQRLLYSTHQRCLLEPLLTMNGPFISSTKPGGLNGRFASPSWSRTTFSIMMSFCRESADRILLRALLANFGIALSEDPIRGPWNFQYTLILFKLSICKNGWKGLSWRPDSSIRGSARWPYS